MYTYKLFINTCCNTAGVLLGAAAQRRDVAENGLVDSAAQGDDTDGPNNNDDVDVDDDDDRRSLWRDGATKGRDCASSPRRMDFVFCPCNTRFPPATAKAGCAGSGQQFEFILNDSCLICVSSGGGRVSREPLSGRSLALLGHATYVQCAAHV